MKNTDVRQQEDFLHFVIIVGSNDGTAPFQTRAAENDVTMDGNVTWSYLDDGSDPAGDSIAAGYDRTSWTKDDYDISAWKTATGPFGAKKGKSMIWVADVHQRHY